MKNLITAALLALLFFASASADADHETRITVPSSSVEVIPHPDPPPPDVIPPPDVTPPPVAGEISDPERTTALNWPTDPNDIPAWVPEGAHWFLTAEQSESGGITSAGRVHGINAFKHTIRDTHHTEPRTEAVRDAILASEIGDSCVTYISKRYIHNPGVIVESEAHYRTGNTHLMCDAIPRDDAAAWLLAFGPGEHPQAVNIRSRWPWIIQGVREAGKNLTVIDGISRNVFLGERNWRNKTIIGGKHAGNITVRNIDIVLARFDTEGVLLTTGLNNDSFRCIMPGDGKLLVQNVTLSGCKNGIQGLPGESWTLQNVRIENASAKGSGLRHGVYTDALDLLLIEDSYIHSRAGYPVKSRARKTVIRNTTLTEGGGDTGAAVQTHGGALEMTDVTLIQPPSKGSARIFHIGGKNGARCIGNQPVTLTRVEIIDNDPRVGKQRFLNTCGRTEFKDGGGNTYSHMGGPARNLFKDGRVDLKGVQP